MNTSIIFESILGILLVSLIFWIFAGEKHKNEENKINKNVYEKRYKKLK